MKKMILAAAAMLLAGSASAAVVLTETFESYADQTAFEAAYSVVAGTGGTTTGVTFSVDAGNQHAGSDKAVLLVGTSSWTANRALPTGGSFTTPYVPTDVDPINLEYWTKSATVPTRLGVSLRAADNVAHIFNLGTWNSTTANNDGTANKYVARFIGIAGAPSASGSNGYYTLLNGPDRVAGAWTKLGVSIGQTFAKFYVNDTEIVADQVTFTGTAIAPGISNLRIGLGVTAANDTLIDDVVVSTGAITTDVQDWDLY
ncbi:hypothetical protein GC173_10620 [bacterium]|nr:hypothetical protein [bacterium]